jgi:PAS domain S-box-containing protein/putative nucleotidyltransferase with HDIG domain
MIRTGFNKRFKDPSLTLFQMLIATFWTMVVLYYAASARSIVLLLYLVIFVFGLFRLKVREFLFLSLFAVAAYATVILLLYQNHPESINWKIDVLNLLVLAMVLPWFSLIGGYITKLRAKISNALFTIRQSEEKYRTILESIEDGYYEVDLVGNFTFFNDSLCRIHGYSKEELMGMNYRQYENKEFLKVFQTYNKVYNTGEPIKGFDRQIIRKDGTKRYIEASASLRKDSSGEPIGFRGISRDVTERKRAEVELQQTLESLKKAFGTIIQVMASAVEMKDPYTAGHQIRAADIAVAIAEEMGLNQEKIDGIRMSATIHDIGKLSVPAELLSKPTKLTDIEFTLIKEHSHSGYEMLKNVESPWPLAEIIHQHHERMNGTGYPRNLKEDEILIEARILAVADVVEAMASHRPYRAALGIEVALEEIEKNKGILYDAAVADACLKLFREKNYQFK